MTTFLILVLCVVILWVGSKALNLLHGDKQTTGRSSSKEQREGPAGQNQSQAI